jgi:hypothetical protein
MTTTIPVGAPYTAKAEWLQYDGGPPALVTGVTVTITRLIDTTIVVGPTSTGVVHVALGLDVYNWTPPAGHYEYAIVFDGLSETSTAVQAVETVIVGAADFTNDPSTSIGKVRLLISDVDSVSPIFSDTSIGAFLAMSGSNVRLAAAQALDAIATSEVLTSKVLKTLDLETDGAKVAAELRAQAKTLRDTAADYDAGGNLFGMTIVDYVPYRWPGDELAETPWCP